MKRFVSTILIILLCSNSLAALKSINQNDIKKIDKEVNGFFKKNNIQGLSVNIFNSKKSMYQKHLGYSDNLQNTKIDKHSKFKLANTTQLITALIILTLHKNKQLNINDPITKYLKNLDKRRFAHISIKNLIQHYSGISRDYWACSFKIEKCNQDTFYQFINNELLIYNNNESIFNYSNNGYILLGLLIEKVTGESYKDYTLKYLKNDLQLNETSFETQSVKGYKNYKLSDDIKLDELFNSSSGLVSTTNDIEKLLRYYLKNNQKNEFNQSISSKYEKVGVYQNNIKLPWFYENNWHTYYGGSLNSEIILSINKNKNIGISISHDSYSKTRLSELASNIIKIIIKEQTTISTKKKIGKTKLKNYKGYYSSFFGGYYLEKDNTNYLTKYNSHKVKLSPNTKGTFDLTFILFSILPIRTQEIKDANIFVSYKQGRDRLILEYKGQDQFVFGEKIPILTYTNLNKIIGTYYPNVPNNPIDKITLTLDKNILILQIKSDFFEQFIQTNYLKIPLKQINNSQFITYGLGTEWDGTVSIQKNRLRFSGLEFSKK